MAKINEIDTTRTVGPKCEARKRLRMISIFQLALRDYSEAITSPTTLTWKSS